MTNAAASRQVTRGDVFCRPTDLEAALIAGEGAANARLVAVKVAIVSVDAILCTYATLAAPYLQFSA